MKHIFLASSINEVASHISKKIEGKGLKLAFIKTASEVEKGDLWWLRADREALVKAGFEVSDYTLTNKTKTDVENDLRDANILFFSGGNTFYLLQKIQESNSAEIIKKFVENGKIYIGSSAGSLIAGPDIYPAHFADDLSLAPEIKGYKGLNLVNFIPYPHWGSDEFKSAYSEGFIKSVYNEGYKNILLTNYQYIEIIDNVCKIEDIKTR